MLTRESNYDTKSIPKESALRILDKCRRTSITLPVCPSIVNSLALFFDSLQYLLRKPPLWLTHSPRTQYLEQFRRGIQNGGCPTLPSPSLHWPQVNWNQGLTTRKSLIVSLTCLGLTGTRNGQASSCFSISAKIMRQGAMSLEACFRLACGRTSSLGGGVRDLLSSFSSSSSLNFRFRRGLLRF